MESWNDLQLVELIARRGSLAAAARELEVDYSTVFRRLNALEKRLNARLFDRNRQHCTPTPAGERLAAAAASAKEAVDSALLDIAGEDTRLTGTIRITTVASFAEWVLMPLFARFRAKYPAIRLELVESFALYNLSQREADIAIRFTAKPPENLIGIPLGSMGSAVYGSQEYLAQHPGQRLSEMDWIMPTGDSVAAPEVEWHRKHVPPERIVMTVNSGNAGRSAALQHMGLGLLICYLGDGAGLIRVSEPIEKLDPKLWLLTHPNLRNVARIRAFLDFLKAELRPRMPTLRGEHSQTDLRPL